MGQSSGGNDAWMPQRQRRIHVGGSTTGRRWGQPIWPAHNSEGPQWHRIAEARSAAMKRQGLNDSYERMTRRQTLAARMSDAPLPEPEPEPPPMALADKLRLTFHPQHALGRACRRAALVSAVAIAVHNTHPDAERRWEWSLKTVQLFLLWCGIISMYRFGPHDSTPPLFLFFFLLITLKLEGVFLYLLG